MYSTFQRPTSFGEINSEHVILDYKRSPRGHLTYDDSELYSLNHSAVKFNTRKSYFGEQIVISTTHVVNITQGKGTEGACDVRKCFELMCFSVINFGCNLANK